MKIFAPLLLSLLLFVTSLSLLSILPSSKSQIEAHAGCGHSAVSKRQKMYFLNQEHDPFSRQDQDDETKNKQQKRSAEAQASTIVWKANQGFARNMTLVNNPQSDTDLLTGLARSCSSTGQLVFVGGSDSGQNCFDANGVRVFQDFCRLFCVANETLNATHKQRLDRVLGDALNYFASSPLQLEVWDGENSSLNLVSDEKRNCQGIAMNSWTSTSVTVIVTTRPTRQLGGITASAEACQLLEMNSRPILVYLNVNPAIVYPQAGYTDSDLKELLIHQMMHGLGFANASYPLYRHPSDPTKTYFQYSAASFPTGPISSSASTGFTNNGNGDFWLDQTKIVAGQKIYFKGPNVAKVAQLYFGCPNIGPTSAIPGVELENGGSSQMTTGVHWEKRLFLNELLIGTNSWKMYFSSFSMALLQDTGFWNVPTLVSVINWTEATAMNYGRSKGCNFLSQKCDQWPTQLAAQAANSGENSNYFCTEVQGGGCSFDRSFIAECNEVSFGSDLPAVYQYFSATSAKLGGQDPLMDYCPIYRLMLSGECDIATNSQIYARDVTSGMNFGSNSRCYLSNMLNSSSVSGGKSFGGCFQTFCHYSEQVGYVVVGRDAIRCTKDNAIVELFPPARFNVNNFVPQTGTDVLQLSYNYHGTIQCASLFSECQAQRQNTLAYKNSPIKLANVTSATPTIASVSPNWGYPTGGSSVTVIGANLDRCAAAIIGGIALTDFQIINSSAVRGKIGNVGSVFGGPGTDGVGDALVELQCRINEFTACASGSGCIVARAKGVFNYSLEDPAAVAAATGVFSDFFDSTAGKAVGIIMCVIVIIILIVVARLCFKDGEKVGPKYEAPKENNNKQNNNNNNNNISNNNGTYHSPLVIDGLNDNEGFFTPTNGDSLVNPQNVQQSTTLEQELEPIVVMI